MRVAFAADDVNECVDAVLEALHQRAEVFELGPPSWPEMSQAVANGDAGYGVLMCWTGTGTAIAANKVPGVRDAQATDAWIAENARRWNDANVLTISLKRTAPAVAVECVNAFLDVGDSDSDELEQVAKLSGK
jgi:ribose 5-phosphate isomerase B